MAVDTQKTPGRGGSEPPTPRIPSPLAPDLGWDLVRTTLRFLRPYNYPGPLINDPDLMPSVSTLILPPASFLNHT